MNNFINLFLFILICFYLFLFAFIFVEIYRVLISYEREISPEIDIQETEESRIALENELRELLICSSINSREKKLVQRLKSGLGLGKKTDIDKENEDRMRESERGINEKSSENGKLDEKKKEELIWREIVSHHIAIESLRAKECRENIASCNKFFSIQLILISNLIYYSFILSFFLFVSFFF